MRKAIIVSTIIAILILAITFISFTGRVIEESELEKISFRSSWLINPGNTGEVVAKEERIFEKNGLDVEILPGGFELDPNKLVAIKEDTFGFPKAEEYLIAKSKGLPIIAIAAVNQKNPTGFAVMESSDIYTIKDFEGKKVGVKYGTNTETIYNWLLSEEEVDKSTIEEVPLKFNPSLFLEGKIDVYPGFMTNDLLYIREKGHDIRLIDSADYNLPFYGSIIITHVDTLENNPELVLKFLESIKEGWEIAYELNNSQVEEYLRKHNPALEGNLSIGFQAYKSYIFDGSSQFGEMSEKRWEDSISILQSQNLVDTLNVSEVYDDSFISKIN